MAGEGRVAPESRVRYEVFTWLAFFNASRAATWTACHGVRSTVSPRRARCPNAPDLSGMFVRVVGV